jgi:hypothetical protein
MGVDVFFSFASEVLDKNRGEGGKGGRGEG